MNPVVGALARLILALTSAALGWMAVEAVARLLLGPPIGGTERVLFFTSPSLVQWGRGVRYAPNSRIRTVALYGERVEYDVSFFTNDIGLIDHQDYTNAPAGAARERYVFVGDSFTAGFHGGQPWVPQLRDRARTSGRSLEI